MAGEPDPMAGVVSVAGLATAGTAGRSLWVAPDHHDHPPAVTSYEGSQRPCETTDQPEPVGVCLSLLWRLYRLSGIRHPYQGGRPPCTPPMPCGRGVSRLSPKVVTRRVLDTCWTFQQTCALLLTCTRGAVTANPRVALETSQLNSRRTKPQSHGWALAHRFGALPRVAPSVIDHRPHTLRHASTAQRSPLQSHTTTADTLRIPCQGTAIRVSSLQAVGRYQF